MIPAEDEHVVSFQYMTMYLYMPKNQSLFYCSMATTTRYPKNLVTTSPPGDGTTQNAGPGNRSRGLQP